MNLREEIRRLAENPLLRNSSTSVQDIESAILEGVKLVLERELSASVKHAGEVCIENSYDESADQYLAQAEQVYRAITQELIKELTEEDRNAETKRSTA